MDRDEAYRLAVETMDAAFGLGLIEAHKILARNSEARRIYDCAISVLMGKFLDQSPRDSS